jgi:ABC-type transport system involved in multi-copper enzyme maturation permease subunit
MQMPLIATARRVLSPAWLTGPILDKELRVSSRRRRNYALRVVYLLVLASFVALAWIEGTRDYGGGAGFRISRMAQVGKGVISTITWVQFFAAQLLAVVMLSTAISEEIHHRTLAALMSTPITSLQIVLGKLFSKLLQILLLLAISLPVLAVVRVFGGVPWNFVVAGVCVTMTASIFIGSISLLLSVSTRRSYSVIIRTLVIGAILNLVVPMILGVLWVFWFANLGGGRLISSWASSALNHLYPLGMMYELTDRLLTPRGTGAGLFFGQSWPLHCLIMLGFCAVILSIAVKVVRRASLREATGRGGLVRRPRPGSSGTRRASRTGRSSGPIRRIAGSPVLWKELNSVVGRWSRQRTWLFIAMGVSVLVFTYLLCILGDFIDRDETHMCYGAVLMTFALLGATTTCATGIPIEKESRTWAILLSTTLGDGEIVLGKMIGAVRRGLPTWSLLFGHIVLFCLLGIIHPMALVQISVLVFGVVVLLAGLGAYVGSLLHRANAAVVVCLGVALATWVIFPFVFVLACDAFGAHARVWSAAMTPNPVVQTIAIMSGTAGRRGETFYFDWPGSGAPAHTLRETNRRILATMLAHAFVGVVLAWLAKRRFRRKVF